MATDFFAAQDAARSRSRRLVVLFLASVVGLILAIYLLVMLLMLGANDGRGSLWDAEAFVWVAGLTTLVVGVASLGKMASLRSGGGSVARSVGGRLVDPQTTDSGERRLLNVVEEMALAAGVPVPEVYVLDAEEGINAFAAGFTTRDAAVAVTRGCLEKLNRDELQGVIAHEFSHILNGDMRLNIQLIGLVFGLLVLAIIGQTLMRIVFYTGGRSRSRDSKDSSAGLVFAIMALGLILFLVGWVGVLFGRLLQSAVSRQREFLADASAVQFTRHPDGLAGALRKIGAEGSRVTNPHSQDVAHLFFANALRMSWWGLFATHPPLEQRIRAIDPGWDGSFESVPPPLPRSEPPSQPAAAVPGAGLAFAARAFNQLSRAQTTRQELSARLGEDWRAPSAAKDITLALLPSIPDTGDTDGIRIFREKLADVAPGQRLALVSMLMPALARLSPDDRAALLARLNLLGGENAPLDAFDFGVWWVVRRNLGRMDHPAKPKGQLDKSPSAFASDVSILLASLAHIGADNDDEAIRAFETALAPSTFFGSLCVYPGLWPDTNQLDQALQNLGNASFALRQEILAAAARAVTNDGLVTDSESAILQLVSIALDCPASLGSQGVAV